MRLPIRLDAFLKLTGAAQTGGHAKLLIQEGAVAVDGATETRRGRKLRGGERVVVDGAVYCVAGEPAGSVAPPSVR